MVADSDTTNDIHPVAPEDMFYGGLYWVWDVPGSGLRCATPGEMSAEIKRLRAALVTVEQMANEGRDDAIDNRGQVIELYEANQFEQIGAFARSVQNVG
jgi:hypothetical protein